MQKNMTLLPVIILLLAAVVFSGCQKDKKDVKLLTPEQSKEYVSKNLPAAKYVSEKKLTDKTEFTFEDELCGFTFTVTSEASEKQFDAMTVGYDEKTSDNWLGSYFSYLRDKVSDGAEEIAEKQGIGLQWSDKLQGSVFLMIKTDKATNELEPVLKELGALIKAEDKHNKLSQSEIWCYSGEDCTVDKVHTFYRFETGEVVDKETRARIVAEKNKNNSAG